MKSATRVLRFLPALSALLFLMAAACNPAGPRGPALATRTASVIATSLARPTLAPTSTPARTATPSPVPTYPLDLLAGRLPSVTPAYGFVVLELPESVRSGDSVTVTILTAAGTDCSLTREARPPDLKVADSNGICSWTWIWKRPVGKGGSSGGPGSESIWVHANGKLDAFTITLNY